MATQPQPDGVLAQLPEVASETLQMAQAATASTFTFADRSGKQITKRPKDFTDDDLQGAATYLASLTELDSRAQFILNLLGAVRAYGGVAFELAQAVVALDGQSKTAKSQLERIAQAMAENANRRPGPSGLN